MSTHQREVRSALSILTALLSFLLLLAGLTAAAEEKRPSRLGQPSSIESVRERALAGDFVTIQGEIVGIKSGRLFELRDDTGKVLAVIPDHLKREVGTPKLRETVRVFGKWDHDPFVAPERAENRTEGDWAESTWGIRVQKLERNLSSSSRNPAHSRDTQPSVTTTRKPASGSPAAIEGAARVVHSPQVEQEFKQRLAAAKMRVLDSQKVYDDASADYARALHQGVAGAELEALELGRANALSSLTDATSAIPPLTAEAREAGVDETLIQMYEKGITAPR